MKNHIFFQNVSIPRYLLEASGNGTLVGVEIVESGARERFNAYVNRFFVEEIAKDGERQKLCVLLSREGGEGPLTLQIDEYNNTFLGKTECLPLKDVNGLPATPFLCEKPWPFEDQGVYDSHGECLGGTLLSD